MVFILLWNFSSVYLEFSLCMFSGGRGDVVYCCQCIHTFIDSEPCGELSLYTHIMNVTLAHVYIVVRDGYHQ